MDTFTKFTIGFIALICLVLMGVLGMWVRKESLLKNKALTAWHKAASERDSYQDSLSGTRETLANCKLATSESIKAALIASAKFVQQKKATDLAYRAYSKAKLVEQTTTQLAKSGSLEKGLVLDSASYTSLAKTNIDYIFNDQYIQAAGITAQWYNDLEAKSDSLVMANSLLESDNLEYRTFNTRLGERNNALFAAITTLNAPCTNIFQAILCKGCKVAKRAIKAEEAKRTH